ncbi:putative quinol monooxygenase [Kineococcus indalonis]|uniref:putative quinol monooxygenase n=1 Tax=Kineococcus indalonis TaxID=2696566 RepID=UPI0014135BB4|nr:antibiotic biosynthesis monooxygenase family protein [Kineococcus indalonis]NAZ85072.1 antibiotic biosynthesis monooxygenase [Kineococcus indalonis]
MTITSLLELRLKPEALESAPAIITQTLEATRAFEGCLGVDVLRDTADPAHVVVVERWASLEDDDAYRAWRATPEGASRLAAVLSGPPVLTRLSVDTDL